MALSIESKHTVLDLFSGCGGMSYGFFANPKFNILGAVDRQSGKPSSGVGTLECNRTYQKNIGITPLEADLSSISPAEVADYIGSKSIDVLISCAPCTGFSRTIRKNLQVDDPRNSLVARTAEFVNFFQPKILLMENVGELLKGKFSSHLESLCNSIEQSYEVRSELHKLSEFGVPQSRVRALVVGVRKDIGHPRAMSDLWKGYSVAPSAVTVRRAIEALEPIEAGKANPNDDQHVSPGNSDLGLRRLRATPRDGGDWTSWVEQSDSEDLLIPSMKKQVSKGRVGPYRDVYGRLWWDRPAVTLKRECSHTGNGRYAHPEQNRLCSVREMSVLQGFPNDYVFVANSLSNKYRHIGDSVPPIVSFQLSKLCEWIFSGERPQMDSIVLPNTSLQVTDIVPTQSEQTELALN